jgi:hypothetical protein
VPVRHWTELSEYDRQRYSELRVFFRQQQKDFLRDRKSSPFGGEIVTILAFIDQSTPGRDSRCIMCGLGCAGPFLCVNTQRLKHLLGRCKSSINTSFQQIGYGVLRNRAKGRDALWAIIPELRADPGAVRQWTVRSATDSCVACFFSPFAARALPSVVQEDFIEEKKNVKPPAPEPAQWAAPLAPKVTFEQQGLIQKRPGARLGFDFAFGFGAAGSDGEDDSGMAFPEFPASFSVDFLSGFDGAAEREADTLGGFAESNPAADQPVPRSQSVNFGFRFT